MRVEGIQDALLAYWEVALAVRGYRKMTTQKALHQLYRVEGVLYCTHPIPHTLLKRVHALQDQIIYSDCNHEEVNTHG